MRGRVELLMDISFVSVSHELAGLVRRLSRYGSFGGEQVGGTVRQGYRVECAMQLVHHTGVAGLGDFCGFKACGIG